MRQNGTFCLVFPLSLRIAGKPCGVFLPASALRLPIPTVRTRLLFPFTMDGWSLLKQMSKERFQKEDVPDREGAFFQ